MIAGVLGTIILLANMIVLLANVRYWPIYILGSIVIWCVYQMFTQ